MSHSRRNEDMKSRLTHQVGYTLRGIILHDVWASGGNCVSAMSSLAQSCCEHNTKMQGSYIITNSPCDETRVGI